MKKAVDVVISNNKNQILVLKRSSVESHYPSLWDFPGGGVREGEDLKEAAEREVKEEAGLNVSELEVIGIYEDSYNKSAFGVPTHSVSVVFKGEVKK